MTVEAIDVSSWQHPNGEAIDFAQVKQAGKVGVWIKCTQGTGYINPYFKGDVEAALAVGLVVGAYHFSESWKNTPEAEANYALNACEGLDLALGIALDIEQLGTMQPHEAGPWANAFLESIAAQHNLAPLYTDQSLLAQMPGAPWNFMLWIADPSDTYQGVYWAKQTGKAEVPGVGGGPCDVDVITNIRGINPTQPGGAPPASPAQPAPPAAPPAAPPQPPTEGMLDVNVPELSLTNPGPNVVSGAVKTLQTLLVTRFGANLSAAGGIDGRFGQATSDAVKWVQGESHGALTPDGIVGPATWSWLVNFNE